MRMRGAGNSSYKVALPPDRVDVYYFDHGNARYLRTTDLAVATATEVVAEQTERYATRFWAELFGTLHIGFAFLTAFILQLIRFLLFSALRPLTVGVIQLVSDYCFKPLLTAIFNGVLQPPLIFLYNLANSFRDLCEPLADAFGHFLRPVANLIRAFRIIEINNIRNETSAIAEPV
ncbi:uncharacterized protein LOC113375152 [Ctenocephalides felis]|uniref:uncharacterized protein LOC113375152 n=1 Tax=Ctenocephalides felis TaxID=7515 RepID=UPI000E6E4D67|nr:uncharacterized protein LOC113375152 [Ctenocephalides felis]